MRRNSIEFPLAGGAPPPLVLELGVWLLAVASCYVLGDSELSVSGGAAECCQRPESDFRGPVQKANRVADLLLAKQSSQKLREISPKSVSREHPESDFLGRV